MHMGRKKHWGGGVIIGGKERARFIVQLTCTKAGIKIRPFVICKSE